MVVSSSNIVFFSFACCNIACLLKIYKPLDMWRGISGFICYLTNTAIPRQKVDGTQTSVFNLILDVFKVQVSYCAYRTIIIMCYKFNCCIKTLNNMYLYVCPIAMCLKMTYRRSTTTLSMCVCVEWCMCVPK